MLNYEYMVVFGSCNIFVISEIVGLYSVNVGKNMCCY